jgi:protein expanded
MDSDCDYVTLPIPLEGESYLQGSEDTAPTEDEYEKDLLEVKPPAPPQRIDSMSLSNLVELPKPPPYNAHHEKTGLRGPDISPEIPSLPIRESQVYPRKSLRSLSTVIPPSTIPEETPARFITTRPHINILKAHTSLVGESTKPSYAAPTVNTINNLSQSPLPTTSAATSLSLGIPIVPYHNLHAKSHLSHSSRYPEAKTAPRTCVLLPVIKPRSQQYVPPPSMPTMQRQPPPPPPQAQLATVYTSQLARSQIELYQQQLYSDVDYVIYPLQDPAVSQQEYLDSKQGSILAAMAQTQPPPYLAYHTVRAHNRSWDGNHALYRSTPFLSMAISSPSRYASTQNLSDTYIQLPGTYSHYSPSVASLCSSYDATMPPPPLPPLRPPRIAPTTTVTSSSIFSRSRSDDNILNSIDVTPKSRRPIPIPPAYDKKPIRKPPMPVPIESLELPPSGKLHKHFLL